MSQKVTPQNNQMPETIGQRIRHVREQLEMSRPKFANLIGIPPTTLKNYECGYRDAVPASLLLKLIHCQGPDRFADYLLAPGGLE